VPRPSENDDDAVTSVDDDKASKSEVVERMSHHSYEEIAASEANSEVTTIIQLIDLNAFVLIVHRIPTFFSTISLSCLLVL
jgi:hypothetical protein